MIEFAEKNQIVITKDSLGEDPYSVDANLLHTSSEGKLLEDPWVEPPEYVFTRTKSIEQSPNKAESYGIPILTIKEILKEHLL